MIALAAAGNGTILAVKAAPGSRRNAVLGERDQSLRVAVTAAPERGAANEAIVTLLADALGVKRSQVSLLTGQASRAKRFLVKGVSLADMTTRLTALLDAVNTPR